MGELLDVGGFGAGGGILFLRNLARDVDDVAADAVVGEVMLRGEVALGPFARRGVGADEEHGDGCSGDDNERDDEGNAPGDMWGHV